MAVAKIRETAYKPINWVLGDGFIVPPGESGLIVVDEAAERVVGAGLGWATNSVFAWWLIRASRKAFKSPESTDDLEAVVVEDIIVPDDVLDEGKAGPARGGGGGGG